MWKLLSLHFYQIDTYLADKSAQFGVAISNDLVCRVGAFNNQIIKVLAEIHIGGLIQIYKRDYFLACLVPADFFGVGELLAEAVLPEFLVLLRLRPGPDCS